MQVGTRQLPVTLMCAAGVPHFLFGFEGQQLIGKPLSSTIDIFTDWKEGHGEELSLLELLVTQLAATTADSAAGYSSDACPSWRVGVHRPQVQDQSGLVSVGHCSNTGIGLVLGLSSVTFGQTAAGHQPEVSGMTIIASKHTIQTAKVTPIRCAGALCPLPA